MIKNKNKSKMKNTGKIKIKKTKMSVRAIVENDLKSIIL